MILRRIADLPEEGVSHDVDVLKRVVLRHGEVPHLCQFATSKIPPGVATSAHSHTDMIEVFRVQTGQLRVTIDGTVHDLAEGDTITIQLGEVHVLENPASQGDLEILYFGIQVEG